MDFISDKPRFATLFDRFLKVKPDAAKAHEEFLAREHKRAEKARRQEKDQWLAKEAAAEAAAFQAIRDREAAEGRVGWNAVGESLRQKHREGKLDTVTFEEARWARKNWGMSIPVKSG
jgi:hypothetical protein